MTPKIEMETTTELNAVLIERERAYFEAWVKRQPWCAPPSEQLERDCQGTGIYRYVQPHWAAWQGRAALASRPQPSESAEPFAWWWMDEAGNEGMRRDKPLAEKRLLRPLFVEQSAQPAQSSTTHVY